MAFPMVSDVLVMLKDRMEVVVTVLLKYSKHAAEKRLLEVAHYERASASTWERIAAQCVGAG
jgi:hypothetical protein